MMMRSALLGCVAAGLLVSLQDTSLAAPAADPSIESFESPPVEEVVRVRRVKRPVRRAAILPPSRPGEPDAAAEAVAAVPAEEPAPAFSFDTVPTAPVQAAVAVLPPLRPSFPADAAAQAEPAQAQAQAEIEAVELVNARPVRHPEPPARPEFSEPAASGAVVATLPPGRPGLPADPVETATLPDAAPVPEQPRSLFGSLFSTPLPVPSLPAVVSGLIRPGRDGLNERIAVHAKLNDVPEALVHRVVIRESRYNPRAIGRGGALGLMQIKHATARGLGYTGTSAGLLDAETNLTYAVKYLAGAYRVAGGDFDRAVMNYARGYYYESKRQAGAQRSRRGRRERMLEANAAAALDRGQAVDTGTARADR
ncbi:MAG: emtA [Enterovirga sp.]|nr:emtA [Enterovirga sp.]